MYTGKTKRIRRESFSPLFEGMTLNRDRLRVVDKGRFSVLTIHGVEVIGSRQVLERVRDGLIMNGGPQRLNAKLNKN